MTLKPILTNKQMRLCDDCASPSFSTNVGDGDAEASASFSTSHVSQLVCVGVGPDENHGTLMGRLPTVSLSWNE